MDQIGTRSEHRTIIMRPTKDHGIVGPLTVEVDGQAVSGDVAFMRWSNGAWTMEVGNDGEGSCDAFAYFRAGDLCTADSFLHVILETLADAAARRHAQLSPAG